MSYKIQCQIMYTNIDNCLYHMLIYKNNSDNKKNNSSKIIQFDINILYKIIVFILLNLFSKNFDFELN